MYQIKKLIYRKINSIAVFVILIIASGNTSMAQNTTILSEDVFTVVEEMPDFTGGEQEKLRFISQNIVYPQSAKEAGLSGKCYLKFIVGSNGFIRDIQVLKGVPGCKECDNEAIRVVKLMPRWKAGKQNGKNVNVSLNYPILFKLN